MTQGEYPLGGVKVLDLSRVLAGPVCCQVLADLGTDVVKVERPGTGDDTRQWGPPFLDDRGRRDDAAPTSAYYLSANRGKRSLALDLSPPEGRRVLDDLIRGADVLVENFLPQSLERLGLAPERLRRLNGELVSVSISGYGRTGPLAEVAGYDLVIQAMSGLMSITGEADGMPMKVGVAIIDVISGLYAAISVLAGLHRRGSGKGGTAFDLALADCTLASLVNVAQGSLITGEKPRRYGNAHPQIVPYEAFATSDGHLVLAVGNDRQWLRFCQATGHDDWAQDPRFATNPSRVEHREQLVPLLEQLFSRRTSGQWQQILSEAEVPHSPVLALDEVLASRQVAARRMVLDVEDSAARRYRLVGNPIHWRDAPSGRVKAPPALGEHTDEILRVWLGYDEGKIAELRRLGTVA